MKLLAVVALAACFACTPAAEPIVISQVPADVVTDIGCFVADALAGTQSLAQIFAQCGALTAAQAAALLDALAQGGGIALKAGANVVHVPAVTLSAAQHARVAELRAELAGVDGGAP